MSRQVVLFTRPNSVSYTHDWNGYVVGATYQLTFWGKVESTEGLRGRVPVLTIPPGGGNGLIFAYVDVTSPEWTKYSMTFSTPTASDGIRIRCYESTNTLNAVSYTHLDVYKRQAKGCADLFPTGDLPDHGGIEL